MSLTAHSEQVPVFVRRNRGHSDALHGHPLYATTMRISVAEAAGTFFLVLTIISAAIAAMLGKPVSGRRARPEPPVVVAACSRLRPGPVRRAIGAALVAWARYGHRAGTVAYLSVTYPASGVGRWRALGAEGVVTFLLVTVVVTNPRVPGGMAAMAICFALATAILLAGPLTGAMAGMSHAPNRSGATARAAGRRGHGRPVRPG